MANSRLEAKLAKRHSTHQSSKLGIKDKWYYACIYPDLIKLIGENESAKGYLSSLLDDKKHFIKMGNQSIHLLSDLEPKIGTLPTATYMGKNLYGLVYIFAVLNDSKGDLIDYIPFTTAISAIEALWFPQNTIKAIEIVLDEYSQTT